MKFLGKLGIDFKLLFAQIINFLVLLWLLQQILYKPIIKNLEERTRKAKKIEEGEREIQRKKEEMEKKEEEIIQAAKRKTKQIIEEGKEISEKEKERVLKRVGEEVGEILKKARERAKFEVEKIKSKEEEKILEKTDSVLEEVLSRAFSRELHRKYIDETIEEMKKVDFGKVKNKEIISVLVVSAYPLSQKEEKQISNFLFSKLKNPHFEEKTDSSLIAGIKVEINGFLIDGSLKGKIKKAIFEYGK